MLSMILCPCACQKQLCHEAWMYCYSCIVVYYNFSHEKCDLSWFTIWYRYRTFHERSRYDNKSLHLFLNLYLFPGLIVQIVSKLRTLNFSALLPNLFLFFQFQEGDGDDLFRPKIPGSKYSTFYTHFFLWGVDDLILANEWEWMDRDDRTACLIWSIFWLKYGLGAAAAAVVIWPHRYPKDVYCCCYAQNKWSNLPQITTVMLKYL